MRLVPVRKLQEGMRIAKKIYSDEGIVLLADGVELTSSLIRRLIELDIGYIYVEDGLTEGIHIPEMLHEETRRSALQSIRKNFQSLSESSKITKGYLHLGKDFTKMMEAILCDVSSQEESMIFLMDMNTADHYLYKHSLNVCVYALVLGIANGYTEQQLIVLGLGALLHDIGKTQIPQRVLAKPQKLTDEEYKLMQAHAEIGYKILKDEPNIPLLAAHCAYQHHERLNGSGYPRGIKGNDIHEYAQWVALADSYDAMTSHRVYRPAMLPHQAIEVLYTGSGTLYDQKKLELFRDKVAIYPPGLTVKLSTGETAVVSRIHPNMPHRPVVRILGDAEGQSLHVPYEMDLAKKLSVIITDVDGSDAEPISLEH
ncbi:HD-GYP domain-containing protein [Paenibacillus donghaensis]|uniref:HD-GYP domain-containing protein n=1 Tax=Paenibacillus donghaensis TaxID=414771 RepID=UPI001D16EE7B|nr:HD-GYP domain-containing protein [Paenibacillus donghaensis]MBE9912482.1 HD-GYP domain-containing protein [Paenibacillus donghaensis]